MTDFSYRPEYGTKVADDHIEKLQKENPDCYVEVPEWNFLVHKDYANWLAKYKRGKTFCCEEFKKRFDREGLITNSNGFSKKLFNSEYVFEIFDGCDMARIPFSYCPFCGKELK